MAGDPARRPFCYHDPGTMATVGTGPRYPAFPAWSSAASRARWRGPSPTSPSSPAGGTGLGCSPGGSGYLRPQRGERVILAEGRQAREMTAEADARAARTAEPAMARRKHQMGTCQLLAGEAEFPPGHTRERVPKGDPDPARPGCIDRVMAAHSDRPVAARLAQPGAGPWSRTPREDRLPVYPACRSGHRALRCPPSPDGRRRRTCSSPAAYRVPTQLACPQVAALIQVKEDHYHEP